MSARDQVGRLPRLYRDVCPQLMGRFLSAYPILLAKPSLESLSGASAPPRETLTVDQRAAELEKAGGWAALAHSARTRCREILERNRDEVQTLVEEDLPERVHRGRASRALGRRAPALDNVVRPGGRCFRRPRRVGRCLRVARAGRCSRHPNSDRQAPRGPDTVLLKGCVAEN